MSLLRHAGAADAEGAVHRITPASAGWRYVSFAVFDLTPGQVLARAGGDEEICLVLVRGAAEVTAGGALLGTVGGRDDPFAAPPWSVYIPARCDWRVVATNACELSVCAAPAAGGRPTRVIPPEAVGRETRGTGTNTRHIRNILPDTSDIAESLLVVEVITPGGHWSSYPPHKHDVDDFPRETYLEETYYHRLARPEGFALQRVYTDDLATDETMAVRDRDVVLVPRGYHPVGAPHGFDLYYLNVMAGPVRAWRFTTAPAYAFLGWTTQPAQETTP